ncbi:class E sortase [Alloscardovia criceti]|uniref:class E sortase n=1 Tax=Alloscardovia criceti TaxID=356828 RepID=UPI00036D41AE|nr:class E sortase [Alloscardovia criceti]
MNENMNSYEPVEGTRRSRRKSRGPGVFNSILGIVGEILIIFAVVSALYIVWQLWWTGVEAEKTQLNDATTSSWTTSENQDGSVNVAPDNPADTAPVESTNWANGDTIGKIYVPRFGQNWSRTVVEGTDDAQLARHGLGHYANSQKPGEVGNFAIAGHRAGYGEPLGDADKLTNGDYIVIRTENYWYVYQYDSTEIVTPDQGDVVAPVPHNIGQTPTERYITLTTCEPKYATPTHRLIVYGKLVSWSNVSDGVPNVLVQKSSDGKVSFTTDSARSWSSQIPDLSQLIVWLIVAYVVIALAAAIAWRFPALRAYKERPRSARVVSILGWIMRHQPGVLVVRIVLFLLLALIAAVALFQWGYPWAAANVPYLQISSNYVSVG